MRVLIAEDEPGLLSVLKKRLAREGYAVDACADGADALAFLRSDAEYDAAVLDIMMPRMSGLEALAAAREGGVRTPVLLLTARDAVADRVRGLDAGADDYLVKPFALDELLARLRALTRREARLPGNVFTALDLTVDCDRHRVTRAGQDIPLTAREFSLLEYLIRNAGVILRREQIERHVWNYEYMGVSNGVDVYIRSLRRKLDDPFERKLIQTVRGVGYVLREAP